MIALYISITAAFLMFLFFDKTRGHKLSNLALTLIFLIASYIFVFLFMANTPSVYIRKREREMNMEVLFAARYLLIKMQSGTPFFNSLIDASKGKSISAKFFKEIVNDINTGTPIEEALDTAAQYSPSKHFRRVIWQVNNALKSGIDVTRSLKSIIDEIMHDQINEIERYGKKLGSLSMFYMLVAIVLPSLGMIMFVILASFINLQIRLSHLLLVVLMLAFLQFMFLSIFKSVRPMVNL